MPVIVAITVHNLSHGLSLMKAFLILSAYLTTQFAIEMRGFADWSDWYEIY
jgi:hypothetical protein